MTKPQTSNTDGYVVLITVLVLGIMVAIIATFLLMAGSNALVASEAVESGTEARAAATGCAELALDALQANPTLTTPSTGSSTLNSTTQETCAYTISGTTPNYTVNVTGTVAQTKSNYNHYLTITTTQTTPSVTVSSWQDTP